MGIRESISWAMMSGSGRLALSSRILVAAKRRRRRIVFEPEDVEVSAGWAWVAAASFTAGGSETLSVSREAGHGRRDRMFVALG